MDDTFLVTGVAGFIGYYMAQRLLDEGKRVLGIDNLNDYYDVKLKKTRLALLGKYANFNFFLIDISNHNDLSGVFRTHPITYVVHLAAQAGVRYSIEHPQVYIESNIIGFYNILECCRYYPVKHLVYASSSSVYGTNSKVPFSEADFVDHPVSLYAATKKSNELMAHTYSHLYHIPATGLRFFTVYGPLGRPDMAYYTFTDKYFRNEPIQIFNNGDFDHDLYRDFTFIDDIIEGVARTLMVPPKEISPLHRVLNIGNSQPMKLMDFIFTLESCLTQSLGRKVSFIKEFEPIKPGDVPKTFADTTALESLVNFKPETPINEGLKKFTDWYITYYDKG